jgi:Cft2 family RNA processing exonuclease
MVLSLGGMPTGKPTESSRSRKTRNMTNKKSTALWSGRSSILRVTLVGLALAVATIRAPLISSSTTADIQILLSGAADETRCLEATCQIHPFR